MSQGSAQTLRVRCLGGFEVRIGDRLVTGFESQKVRGLFAYLLCHAHRTFGRDHLAGLLWPESDDRAARHALRQAVYNLRSTLAGELEPIMPLSTDHVSIALHPELTFWLDVAAFDEAIDSTSSHTDGSTDPALVRAIQLYRGDFLADFGLRDSPAFEEWVLAEQERLRESVIYALHRLVSAYQARGEYRLGIHYARQLVAVDPYSEEGHRQLMRLFACSGRRTRALTQYEKLRIVLNEELGVEPLEETTGFYQDLLRDEIPLEEERPEPAPLGPLVPLVGRASQTDRLQESWRSVREGQPLLTLVTGEAGAGKSRLVKSFLDASTSKQRAIVLTGAAHQASATRPFDPFEALLLTAAYDVLPEEVGVLTRLTPETRADLLLLAPSMGSSDPRPFDTEADLPEPDPSRLPASVLELIEAAARHYEPGVVTPIVLFLEDLQWADRASLDLLEQLVRTAPELPIWFLATLRSDLTAAHPLLADPSERLGGSAVERLTVGRLDPSGVEEIACALVELSDADRLSSFLWEVSQGLPLMIAESINLLWDEQILRLEERHRWLLDADSLASVTPPDSLSELIHLRIQRLPASCRRLLTLAAVIGQQFDVDVLRRAANEHLNVVEFALELMLERWLIRQHPRSWSQTGRQSDLVLWARGARRGWFEFNHKAIRDSVLGHLSPLRKRVMHRDVARVLREQFADDLEPVCEVLAYHELAADELDSIRPCLEMARRRALRRGAVETAEWYAERARDIDKRAAQDESAAVDIEPARKRRRERRG